MTRLVISSRDAERIAKSFDDMIGDKGLKAIRRRAVNEIGARLRKDNPRHRAGALRGVPGGADDPRPGGGAGLRRSRIPAPHGDKRSGRAAPRQLAKGEAPGRPTPAHPRHPGARAADYLQLGEAREGRGFSLLPAGPLIARGVGGIRTRARTAFADEGAGGHAELARLRKRAARDLPEAVARQIRKTLTKRR